MDNVTREFIEIARKALDRAYWHATNEGKELNTELAKKVGDALQMVGDLSRMP